jgi:hypothetical protein
VPNWTPHHDYICGSGDSSSILVLGARQEVNGQLQATAVYPLGKSLWYPSIKIFHHPRRQYGRSEVFFLIYQQSECSFYKLTLWISNGVMRCRPAAKPQYLRSGQLASSFWLVCCRLFPVASLRVGFRGFWFCCDVYCFFVGWHLVRKICLDRRGVLHRRHTMVHLLSFVQS